MPEMPDESLFEETKMTFGEHLEELRFALVRSMLGLVIGLAIGFGIAKYVVIWIEIPLLSALTEFYNSQTERELTELYGPLSENISGFIKNNNMRYEDVWVELEELKRVAEISETDLPVPKDGEQPSASMVIGDGPGAPSHAMVKTRVWKKYEPKSSALHMPEPFMIWLKAAFITGITITSPWIFYQIWNFVAAGLYPHEKNYVYLYLPFSLGLFLAGAAMAFFFVFKPVLAFLLEFNRAMNIDAVPRISDWLGFVLMLPLGFGISFQLPLIMLFIERIGIVSLKMYMEKWRIAVLVICIISMVLTPADPISMLMMATPLTILYFGGVLLCLWMPKRKSPFGEGYDPA